MKRKVIQIADTTQMVSLPRFWVKKHDIKKGQELDIEESGNNLMIRINNELPKNKIRIDVSGLSPRLADRFLARAYQLGYDELTITYSGLDIARTLQQKMPELLGFEIFEQTKDTFFIKSISAKLDIDFDSALKKAFSIALSMADQTLDAAAKDNKKALDHITYMDLDLNKFCYFCLRAINKGQYAESDNRILYYLIETLEDVGDAYKEMAASISKSGPTERITKLLTKLNQIFHLSHEFFYNPRKDKVEETYLKLKDAQAYLLTMSKNHENTESRQIFLIEYILRLVYHFTTMRINKLSEFDTTLEK